MCVIQSRGSLKTSVLGKNRTGIQIIYSKSEAEQLSEEIWTVGMEAEGVKRTGVSWVNAPVYEPLNT